MKQASLKELHQIAIAARTAAHAPYSKFKVGAAIRLKSGEIFSGCNVENASYGGTICAERVAICKAVSELGEIEIADVVVVTDSKKAWPPCGMCRQFIAEFSSAKTKVHTGNLKKIQKSYRFDKLQPEAFNSSFLK